jgi:hypothetical protein
MVVPVPWRVAAFTECMRGRLDRLSTERWLENHRRISLLGMPSIADD